MADKGNINYTVDEINQAIGIALDKDLAQMTGVVPLACGGTGIEASSRINLINTLNVYSLSVGEKLPLNTDLNNFTEPGTYYCRGYVDGDETKYLASTIENKPEETNEFKLIVSNEPYVQQEFIVGWSGKKYYRIKSGTKINEEYTWREWKQILNDNSIIPIENGGTGSTTISGAKQNLGLSNVENKSSATIRGELTKANITTALGYIPSEQDTTNLDSMTGILSLAHGGTGRGLTMEGGLSTLKNAIPRLPEPGVDSEMAIKFIKTKQGALFALGDDKKAEFDTLPISCGGTGLVAENNIDLINKLGVKSINNGTRIDKNNNLNDITTIGNYVAVEYETGVLNNLYTQGNLPVEASGRLVVGHPWGGTGENRYQEYTTYLGTRFYRYYNNNTWTDWVRYYNSNYIIPIKNGGTGTNNLQQLKDSLSLNIRQYLDYTTNWRIVYYQNDRYCTASQTLSNISLIKEEDKNCSQIISLALPFYLQNPSLSGTVSAGSENSGLYIGDVDFKKLQNGTNSLEFRIYNLQSDDIVDISLMLTGELFVIPDVPINNPAYSSNSSQAINVAKSYISSMSPTAEEGGYGAQYAYGANWLYKNSTALRNKSDQNLGECDTYIWLILMGIDYTNSPYHLEPSDQKNFDYEKYFNEEDQKYKINKNNYSYANKLKDIMRENKYLSKDLVTAGDMAWMMMNLGRVYKNKNNAKTGDLVFWREPNESQYYYNISHIALLEIENGEYYIYEFTSASNSDNKCIQKIKLSDRTDVPAFYARMDYND